MKKSSENFLSISVVGWRDAVDKVTIRNLLKLQIKHKNKQQPIIGVESTCSRDHVNRKKRIKKWFQDIFQSHGQNFSDTLRIQACVILHIHVLYHITCIILQYNLPLSSITNDCFEKLLEEVINVFRVMLFSEQEDRLRI